MDNFQKAGAVVALPFTFVPQFFFLRKAGLAAGALVILGAFAVAVYFAGAYGIQRTTGNKGVMKTAFFIWLIGSLIAGLYMASQQAESGTTPSTPK